MRASVRADVCCQAALTMPFSHLSLSGDVPHFDLSWAVRARHTCISLLRMLLHARQHALTHAIAPVVAGV
jgi:hypothetical protein